MPTKSLRNNRCHFFNHIVGCCLSRHILLPLCWQQSDGSPVSNSETQLSFHTWEYISLVYLLQQIRVKISMDLHKCCLFLPEFLLALGGFLPIYLLQHGISLSLCLDWLPPPQNSLPCAAPMVHWAIMLSWVIHGPQRSLEHFYQHFNCKHEWCCLWLRDMYVQCRK